MRVRQVIANHTLEDQVEPSVEMIERHYVYNKITIRNLLIPSEKKYD